MSTVWKTFKIEVFPDVKKDERMITYLPVVEVGQTTGGGTKRNTMLKWLGLGELCYYNGQCWKPIQV